jgi:DNA-binding MarR family transcriptional regulator
LLAILQGFDRTSTSQLIDDLARTGLVERAVDNRDRRSHALRLTAPGRKRLAEAISAGKSAEDALTSDLTVTELADLKRLLVKLLATSTDG